MGTGQEVEVECPEGNMVDRECSLVGDSMEWGPYLGYGEGSGV